MRSTGPPSCWYWVRWYALRMMPEPTQTKAKNNCVSRARRWSIVETLASRRERTVSLIHITGDSVETGVISYLPELGPVRPYSPDNSLLAHGVVQFPSGCQAYGSETELVASIRGFIHRYADFTEAFEEAATYYVLSTFGFMTPSTNCPTASVEGDFLVAAKRHGAFKRSGPALLKPMFASGASTVCPSSSASSTPFGAP